MILRTEVTTEAVAVQLTLTGHKSVVNTLALCGAHLWSGASDGNIRIWNVAVRIAPLITSLSDLLSVCVVALSHAAHHFLFVREWWRGIVISKLTLSVACVRHSLPPGRHLCGRR